MQDGVQTLVPARYLLRRPGDPPFMDKKLPGCYNARRTSLQECWVKQFGVTHAVMSIYSFYENVTLPATDEKGVLHFEPKPRGLMWIACLYGDWVYPKTGETLRSFAAVTDEPPPEVAAVGHDRIVINLSPSAVERWLTPQGRSVQELQSILDDRQRSYYEHELAA